MELLVRIRKGVPVSRRRAMNRSAPGIAWSSLTRTPSMSISHDRISDRLIAQPSCSSHVVAPARVWHLVGGARADLRAVEQLVPGIAFRPELTVGTRASISRLGVRALLIQLSYAQLRQQTSRPPSD